MEKLKRPEADSFTGGAMDKPGRLPQDERVKKGAGEKKRFNQDQKLKVLETAKGIGIKEAAKLAGVHYTTVYEWKRQLEARGKEGFLACGSTSPGRGIKRITEEQERGVLTTWERYPGFGPSQIRGQLRMKGCFTRQPVP